MDKFKSVEFQRFKAFDAFTVALRDVNVLVGPNNAGKSTILAAFRILAAGMRRAQSKRAEPLHGPGGTVYGHKVDLRSISVAEENLFYNYDDDEPASIRFSLTSGNSLTLFFPERELCYLIPDWIDGVCYSPSEFRSVFDCSVGFVPILGPVEHNEPLFDKEAARLALFSYQAARNFRNIWWHYPEQFPKFRQLVQSTWPGMDIKPPELDNSHSRPRLHMWCPENRRDREISWSGFGFQVWCQMLTHIVQSKDNALFLIDEPDIYLHSDLQRQLLTILKELGPQIVLATHSTEIVTEAESDDIVIVDKARRRSTRMKSPHELGIVFGLLGSSVNPVLTQLAKSKRALFVEGKDFQILGKFARKLGKKRVANRSDFAVVTADGFRPERARNLLEGMEATLGTNVLSCIILDRDFRSTSEVTKIQQECEKFCSVAKIHERKEIENFVLVPSAIDRAAAAKVRKRNEQTDSSEVYIPLAENLLNRFAAEKKSYVGGQVIAARQRFERETKSGLYNETLTQSELDRLEELWADQNMRFNTIPGKSALSFVNGNLQESYHISLTPAAIIEAMHVTEIPAEMVELIDAIEEFASMPVS